MAPAGVAIKNIATGEFINQDGDSQKIQSNQVIVTVKEIYAAQLTPANPLLVIGGGQVVWPHVLTNTGNTPETYNLSVVDAGGDSGYLNDLQFFHDTNCDSNFQDGVDLPISNPRQVSLAVDGKFCFLIKGTAPRTAGNSDNFKVDVSATGVLGGISLSRNDRADVIAPLLKLSKNVDKTVINLNATDSNKSAVQYSLEVSNIGKSAALPLTVNIDGKNVSKFVLEDPLPLKVMLSSVEYSGAGQLLYHHVSDGDKVFRLYDPANPPAPAQVKGIVVAYDSFAVGRVDQIKINAISKTNTLGDVFSNQFFSYYKLGNEVELAFSNTVSTRIDGNNPVLTPAAPLLLEPGQTSVWNHILTNNGTLPQDFTLAVSDVAGDSGVLGSLQLILKGANGAADRVLSPTDVIQLEAGASVSLQITGIMPSAIQPGDSFQVNLVATPREPGLPVLTITDTANTRYPALTLVKAVDKSSINLSLADSNKARLVYTLDFGNHGNSKAQPTTVVIDGVIFQKVIIEDPLPADVLLHSVNYGGAGQVVYHRRGEAAKTYHSYNSSVDAATIDVIAFAYPVFNNGLDDNAQLTVDVTSTLLGAQVNNQFQASYKYGSVDLSSQSNPVSTRIDGKAMTLSATVPLLRDPGTTAVWTHELKNTGTLVDTYHFVLVDVAGDDGDLSDLILVKHTDSADIILGPTAGLTLQPGESATLQIRGTLPTKVQPNDHFDVKLTAVSSSEVPLQLTRTDRVVTVTPVVDLVKTVDKSVVDFGAGLTVVPLTYTLNFLNKGVTPLQPIAVTIDGQATSRIIFKDTLPANVTLVNDRDPINGLSAFDYAGTGEVLYHLVGEGEHVYHRYDRSNAANNPHPSTINAVAIAHPGFAVGQTDSIKLNVAVYNSATGATIKNIFEASYFYGIESRQSISNEVPTKVMGSATLNANDANYNLIARIALNGNLYLEATCAQCNVRPDVADRLRLRIESVKSGDSEEVVAVETGVNTGIFRIQDDKLDPKDALPSRDMFQFPVGHGNYIIETTKHDKLIATILYCLDDSNIKRAGSDVKDAAGNPVSDNVLVDPFGVVFDSQTNQPIAKAIVRLVMEDGSPATIYDDAGRECAPNRADDADPACQAVITTGDDGAYRFPLVKVARYKLIITAPAGYSYPSVVPAADLVSFHREIKVDGSYGGAFDVTPEGPVEIDIPMDPPSIFSSTLFVKKTTTRKTVEVGDFIDYEITVRNASATTNATKVIITDKLPQGFSYVPGSSKVNKIASEPSGGRGPTLIFTVGDLATGTEVKITYRAQVGAGALRSDAINRAKASENIIGGIYSNEAIAQVTVLPGVFTSEAFVTGKVYTDCNRSGVQDAEEIGVPGVRLLLEDGSYVITDVEGKYNFYGLRPKTHVLKLDRTTLPDDVELIEQSVRHAGDPASRFLDLKAGELHRADFAITTDNATCSGPAMTEIYSRRNEGDKAIGELERALKADLTFETSNPSDVRSLPASGCIVSTGNDCGIRGKARLPTLSSAAKPADDDIIRLPALAPARSLEDYLNDDNTSKMVILNLKDQQVLPFAQTNILFKGTFGARFELKLNDEDVPASALGTKMVIADKQLEAHEYIGLNLQPGKNRISLKQFDPMGNVRGVSVIEVIAPDSLATLKIESGQKIVEANGNNEVLVKVKLVDTKDVYITSRTPVTLETTTGRFRAKDLDDVSPGTQIFVEGGEFTVKLVAPTEPGEATVRVSSGQLKAETAVRFVPELRPMVAAGIVEGMVSFKNFDTNKVSKANAKDGFEDELHSLASANDGKLNAAGRAAMYLKGKVKGEYLLTLSYDSDKDGKQRLFRDIRPDDYYPVYGDSAAKGFDAQSTSKLYVRLDKGRSYAMFGDYTTRIEGAEALGLGQYSRSLTGVRGHYETDTLKTTVFAAQTKSRQVVLEIPAQGISGPYALSGVDGLLVNSEKVEVILRDRNNPGVILSTDPQARFQDYEFEPLSASLIFKAPVPSLDANLNPYSIRVTIEVEEDAADDYWVGGAQVEKKLTPTVSVGAAVVQEDAPDNRYGLASVNSLVRLGDNTKLIAEMAQSDREDTSGQASRVELNYDKGRTNARVYYGVSDKTFDNPAASLSSGRAESGAKLQIALENWGTMRSEAVRTEDASTGGIRQGVQASLERSLNKYLTAEVGARYYDETQQPASLSSLGATPYEGVTGRAKLNVQIPKIKNASAYAEYEQDIEEADRKLMAFGGDYRLGKQGRLYARHEFLSSLSGNFGLNDQQQRNSTVFGMESEYMKDGRVFSEYRVRDAIAAQDVEAAVGLRNRWYLTRDVRLNSNFERVTTLEGSDNTDATAVSLGLEYLANPLWKATGKIDLRWADQADTILNTLGLAYKLSRDWTLLTRNTVNYTNNHNTGDRLQDRFQLGAAWRQVDTNRWDTLTKLEYKLEQDESKVDAIDRDAYIFSTHANYHPVRRWTFAGHYAGKWVTDTMVGGLQSDSATHMIGLRAIHDLTERWEASVQGGWLGGETGGKHYVLGAETGYLVTANLWLSTGYNFMSYKDDDVVGSDFTVDGLYMRLRFKFDEDLFRADKPAVNKTLEPQHVGP